ncbi:MAG: YnbE family lipoprotein [Chlorobiales bacterium]|nr:YnbE family lipoprotein [Chlorobiales bacterium]
MKTISRTVTPLIVAGLALLASCKPTVKVEAPDKPITINMNIKIDHDIRVKLDKDIENILDERKDIF